MNRRPSISVVIVNFHSENLVVQCLQSIVDAEPVLRSAIEYIIVDNGSDSEWAGLLKGFPSARVIVNKRNLGFSRAANRGIRAANGAYILLMNPDTILFSNALSRALAFMEDPLNQRVAILGPRVYDDQKKSSTQASARTFPTAWTAFFTRTSIMTRAWPGNPWARKFLRLDVQHDHPSRVDWVSGCCMLMRSQALDQIGLFDEKFFMYLEDVDLCRRAWMSGYEVAFLPSAEMAHLSDWTSRDRSLRLVLILHRSAWTYYRKYFRGGLIARAFVFIGIALRALFELTASVIRRAVRDVTTSQIVGVSGSG